MQHHSLPALLKSNGKINGGGCQQSARDRLIRRQLTAHSCRIREPKASQTMAFAIVILRDKGTSGLVVQTFPPCSSHHRWLFICVISKRGQLTGSELFQELTLPCSEPTAQRPSSRDPKEKNYTGARGSCFPLASKKRRRGLCHPPRRSRCAAGTPSRRARLTAATGALRKRKEKKKKIKGKERKAHPAQGEARMS